MTLHQKRLLAQAYQSAWFTYSAQAIAVSVDTNGFFIVKTNDSNTTFLPEWLHAMSLTELLNSLSHLTLSLAVVREKQSENQEVTS